MMSVLHIQEHSMQIKFCGQQFEKYKVLFKRVYCGAGEMALLGPGQKELIKRKRLTMQEQH